MAESMMLSGLMTLREMGFFDFFLPFLLFFAVVYGALEKTKVFGEGRKDINAIVALVISLIAATTAWVIESITGFLPWVAFIAIVLVCFLMLVAMVYGDVSELAKSPWIKGGAIIAIIIAILSALYYSLGFDKTIGSGGLGISETDLALVVMIGIGVAVAAMVVKGGGSKK